MRAIWWRWQSNWAADPDHRRGNPILVVLGKVAEKIRLEDDADHLVTGFGLCEFECEFQIIEVATHVVGTLNMLEICGVALSSIRDVVIDQHRNHPELQTLADEARDP